MMAVQFGVVNTYLTAYGIAQNIEISDTCDLALRKNAAGDVKNTKAFSRIKKASFEVISDGTPPAAGDEIYLEEGGTLYRVTSAKVIESNQDFKRLQCEAESYFTMENP